MMKSDPALDAAILRAALGLAAERVQATEALLAELCGVRPRKPRAENC